MIEQLGEYRFSLPSNDGAKLEINEKEIVDNDGVHSLMAFTESAVLKRGAHKTRVSYFQGPRFTVALVLAFGPPASPWRIFNTDDLLPPKDPNEWVDGKISQVRKSSGTGQ